MSYEQAGSRISDHGETAQRRPAIQEQLGRLEKNISNLQEQVGTLLIKIDPVVNSMPEPSGAETMSSPEAPSSEFANVIRDFNDKLERLNQKLTYTIKVIEL